MPPPLATIGDVSLLETVRGLLAPRPIDWRRGAGRPRPPRPEAVDIVVPVYGAFPALQACLRSVAAETNLERHGVVIVLDGPQESRVASLVEEFAGSCPATVRVLRNDVRQGFVRSANRGMSESSRDVVLLNSDTIVTAGWLEKLIDAANADGDTGTVTPLSNHATLCSVPRAFCENLLPAGHDVASFARLVEGAAAPHYPRLPTGVGFCLYIRRALLDDIGAFDADHFGVGYGEENDFCMRALERGWLHSADDATFVFHSGHRSFGATRARVQRRARATLDRLHPRYMSTIAEFMRRDPLAIVRERLDAALRGKVASGAARDRIVHVVHGWPPYQQAGTEMYAWWLARQQRASREVSVYARASDPSRAHGEARELVEDGMRVRLVTNDFTSRNPLRRNAIRDALLERDFAQFLNTERPRLVHIHHLAGHAFSLAAVAARLRIPIVLQIQDWWFLCARVNLYDHQGNRCAGPGATKCPPCAPLTRIWPAGVSNGLMHRIRRIAARRAISVCDAFIAGSTSIRDDYVRAGVIPPSKPVHVIPYGIELDAPAVTRPPCGLPVRFGYVGSIAPHKGLHVAVDAMRQIDPARAVFDIWGDDSALPRYVAELRERAGTAAVSFHGRFPEAEKQRVFASMDVLLVPSIGLESFGLAAREAMTSGVPVVASAGGALSEMFDPGHCGDFFPAGDAAALHTLLRWIVDDPARVDRWSALLPRPKRADEHAREVDQVYQTVLGGS